MTDLPGLLVPEMNLSSEHFVLYRSTNAFGQALSLAHNGYPALLLHQPFNEWSEKHWLALNDYGPIYPTHQQSNEQVLLRMLEKAYQQGRESLRAELYLLLTVPATGTR